MNNLPKLLIIITRPLNQYGLNRILLYWYVASYFNNTIYTINKKISIKLSDEISFNGIYFK